MKREVEEAESGLQAVKKACEGQSFSLNKWCAFFERWSWMNSAVRSREMLDICNS
jgi:hypothetical protein